MLETSNTKYVFKNRPFGAFVYIECNQDVIIYGEKLVGDFDYVIQSCSFHGISGTDFEPRFSDNQRYLLLERFRHYMQKSGYSYYFIA